MKRAFETVGARRIEVAVAARDGGQVVTVGEGALRQERQVTVRQAPSGEFLVEVGGITRTVHLSVQRDIVWLSDTGTADAASRTTRWAQALARRPRDADAGLQVRSPMTGRLVAVHIAVGARVAKGDPLVVVEAMKMEYTLKAVRDAMVVQVVFAVGALVEGGAELVRLSPCEEPP
ncbi:MAG: biotin/lipoyl-binding protein [Myxococcales bacterium]|nr:biotin/lipoyl-binding protein [Myxococcales bacterium]